MISERKLEANRTNSHLSRGPVSFEGKRISRLNAMKSGLTGILIPEEDEIAFERLLNDLVDDLKPEGMIENLLVKEIAIGYWKMMRSHRLEAGVIEWLRALALRDTIPTSTASHSCNLLTHPEEREIEEQDKAELHRKKDKLLRRDIQEPVLLGKAMGKDSPGGDVLGKIIRYRTSIEKAIIRNLHELERQQSRRETGIHSALLAVDMLVTQ